MYYLETPGCGHFPLSQSIKCIFPSLKSISLLAKFVAHILLSGDTFTFSSQNILPFPEKLTTMLISLFASSLLLSSLALGQEEDCTVFKEGACPLEESNIIGNSGDATNAAECQVRIVFKLNFFYFLSIHQKFAAPFDSKVSLKASFDCFQAMCKFEPTSSCNFFTYLGSQCYLLARSYTLSLTR